MIASWHSQPTNQLCGQRRLQCAYGRPTKLGLGLLQRIHGKLDLRNPWVAANADVFFDMHPASYCNQTILKFRLISNHKMPKKCEFQWLCQWICGRITQRITWCVCNLICLNLCWFDVSNKHVTNLKTFQEIFTTTVIDCDYDRWKINLVGNESLVRFGIAKE